MKNITSNVEIQPYMKDLLSGTWSDSKWKRVLTSDRASAIRDKTSNLSETQNLYFMKTIA